MSKKPAKNTEAQEAEITARHAELVLGTRTPCRPAEVVVKKPKAAKVFAASGKLYGKAFERPAKSNTGFAKLQAVLSKANAVPEPKHLTKKEVLKLRPGTWIELWWRDNINTMALLLERPDDHRGDVSLRCLHFNSDGEVVRHGSPTHSQVVRTHGGLLVPRIVRGATTEGRTVTPRSTAR